MTAPMPDRTQAGWLFGGRPVIGTSVFWSRLGIAVLGAALSFNLLLALANAQVTPMSGGIVTAVQGLIMAAALAIGFAAGNRDGVKWLVFLWMVVLLWTMFSIFRGGIDPKTLGDAGMIPAFALLGTALRRRDFLDFLFLFQAVVVLFALWELFDPIGYGAFFDITSYYVNTRGFEAEKFWSEYEGLFLNVQRPDGRFMLPFLGWNRATSVFLEPVSLGNWVAVVTIFIVTFWKDLPGPAKGWLIASNVFLLVACDGRFALLCQVAILSVAAGARFMPRFWHLAFLPGMIMALAALRTLGYLEGEGDDFVGRLAIGYNYLLHLDIGDLIGVTGTNTDSNFYDSGWGYLIQTQSVFGFIGFWFAICLLMGAQSPQAQRFVSVLAIYIVLLMPISNSFVSIKSAAPLFAAYGLLAAREAARRRAGAPPAARDDTSAVDAGPSMAPRGLSVHSSRSGLTPRATRGAVT